jgi:DNA polymerase-3 subunit beta
VKIAVRATDLAFIRRGVKQTGNIDVLRTALLRTDGDGVELIGHMLDRCHVARCPAMVQTSGAAAVQAHRLTELIEATAPDAAITISYADTTVTVAAGRSRYRLPAMPASDFPMVLAPAGDAVTIDLGAADVAALIGRAAELVNKDEDRSHFMGIFLHLAVRRFLTTAVTDGVTLLCRTSTIEAPAFHGIIISRSTAEEIARFGRRCGVTLRTDGKLLEASVDGGRLAIVSRLIDATFPDYARHIPPLAAATVTFATADMLAALARLAAASLRGQATVGMTWDGGDALALCLANEADIAADAIAATTTGSGRVTCARRQRRRLGKRRSTFQNPEWCFGFADSNPKCNKAA